MESSVVSHCSQLLIDVTQNGAAYGDIKLSWIPTDYLPSTRFLLLGSAQRRWAKALVEFWVAAPSDSHDIRLLVDQTSLIDVFRELGPAVFLGVEDIMYPSDIFTWLDHQVRCFIWKGICKPQVSFFLGSS